MINLTITYTANYPIIAWSPYPGSLKYYVYRGIKSDDMIKIGESTGLQYQDTDSEANIMDKMDNVKWLYKVSSIDGAGKEVFFTNTINYEQIIQYPYKGVCKEMIRRNNLVLDKIAGEPVKFYIKRGDGEDALELNQITRDVESALRMSRSENLKKEGGFYRIESINVRIRNSSDKIMETVYGNKLDSVREVILGVYPIVSSGDWLKTLQGKIYVIDSVTHRQFRGLLTMQHLAVKELITSHPYYDLE